MSHGEVVRRTLVVLALVVALPSGCGGGKPAEREATGPDRLPIADTFHQAGDPEWLTSAFGVVWVHKDDGNVVGFDPDSGAVVRTLDTGHHGLPACQGLGHDATTLWACAGDAALVRLDPATGTALQVPAHKRSDEGRLAFSGGLLWYLEAGSNDLVGLDHDGAEAARVPLGEVCTDLAYDAVIFALCPTGHHVLRIEPLSRTVTGTLEVGNPRNGTVGADLFVGDGGGMLQVDPESLRVRHRYEDVGPGLVGNVAATPEEVWVREEDGTFLTEVDPRTHRVVAIVAAPQFPSGGDVVLTAGWVWATASDDDVVVRVAR